MSKQINVVISGVQGYVGMTLFTLVNNHPYLQLVGVHCRNQKATLYQLMPQLAQQQVPVYTLKELAKLSSAIDILLLATPAPVSMELVASLANTKIIIIDLSGAFRLPEKEFNTWYGMQHTAPDFINEACYGLSPWVSNQSNYQLIANPGCYANCALMSLIPLIKADIIKTDSIIIDAKSGVSGSGKQSNPALMFCEMDNNFFPYKIGTHQHTPEIQKTLQKLTDKSTNIRLNTSILPIARGIAMTIYAQASLQFTKDEAISKAINKAFEKAYKDYPLTRYAEVAKDNATNDSFILSLKNVVNTPNIHIGYFIQKGQVTLFSCIDNLLKGAASQAIENINALFQLPLQTGLVAVREAL